MEKPLKIRALSLFSGGLDSMLAVCVLRDQGIEVHAITFESPFFSSATPRASAAQLNLPLIVQDFTQDITGLIESPPHGFGSGMNPCIDCHTRMFKRAGEYMQAQGFHFLCTGEVLNERPMSQNRRSLGIVAQGSGYPELILRPLSARHLPESKPEQLGWVDRTRRLDLEGRSRKRQMELAAHYGIKSYPTPAGGCLLTDPGYSKRLRELKDHEGLDLRLIALLRTGRHFRLPGNIRVIAGRNQKDNEMLAAAATPEDAVLKTAGIAGPVVMVLNAPDEQAIQTAAAICARYSDLAPGQTCTVLVTRHGMTRQLESIIPANRETLPEWLI